MIREYLEITRLFNMGLTGIAPVLGALSTWTNNTPFSFTTLLPLLILFIIGCFSHVYGFVINDLIDIKVDKLSKELTSRPLVSESISRRKAAYFAVFCMIGSFILSIYFFRDKELMSCLLLVSILILAYVLATIYDFASKKYPGMDFFVASAVFFLIIFGAASISIDTLFTNPLIWIVAFIGALQVLFMNMINGAIKDIDHDAKGLAKTLAIRLGAKTRRGFITLPVAFKTVGYGVEIARSILIFLPFLIISPFNQIKEFYFLIRIIVLFLFTIITLYSIHKLFSIKKFDRSSIRKWIGIIVIFMYATTPIMLSSLNRYFIVVAFIPPLWFILSNFVLHGTFLQPKTM